MQHISYALIQGCIKLSLYTDCTRGAASALKYKIQPNNYIPPYALPCQGCKLALVHDRVENIGGASRCIHTEWLLISLSN